MSYKLKEIKIRTDNSEAGIAKINELWSDITNGKIPLLFDSEHRFQQGISPVSKYSNYAGDETGEYDLSIIAVNSHFFKSMEEEVSRGLYIKYDKKDEKGNIGECTKKAWAKVWCEQKSGKINRSFTEDYESTVPAQYTKDGAAHCYLYIAVK